LAALLSRSVVAASMSGQKCEHSQKPLNENKRTTMTKKMMMMINMSYRIQIQSMERRAMAAE
jgi:hypothetical protein